MLTQDQEARGSSRGTHAHTRAQGPSLEGAPAVFRVSSWPPKAFLAMYGTCIGFSFGGWETLPHFFFFLSDGGLTTSQLCHLQSWRLHRVFHDDPPATWTGAVCRLPPQSSELLTTSPLE